MVIGNPGHTAGVLDERFRDIFETRRLLATDKRPCTDSRSGTPTGAAPPTSSPPADAPNTIGFELAPVARVAIGSRTAPQNPSGLNQPPLQLVLA